MHPTLGHSAPAQGQPVPLTPATQAEPWSLFPLDSLGRESQIRELDIPSTPEALEAARDLIEVATQHSLAPAEPVILASASITGTVPHGTAMEPEIRL